MRIIKHTVITLLILLSMGSCLKIEQLSSIPYIKYNNFTIFDSLDILGNQSKAGRLNFYFEDGDGNFGLKEPTGYSDSTNLFFTIYRKTGGVMVPVAKNDPLYLSPYRIPYMDRQGQNKILRGTISVTILYPFYSPTDTIKYDFFVKDRALNKSNVASTGEIVISVNKTY